MEATRRLGNLFLFVVFLSSSFLCISANAQDIRGTYALYTSQNKYVSSMTVDSQNGSNFTISGAGWSGSGSVNGGSGYYDWRFSDGKTGRTTIQATNADGIVSGTVSGSGINWSYSARRTSRPQTDVQTSCVLSTKPTQPDEDGQYRVALENRCSISVYVNIRNGGVDYGLSLNSMAKARQAIGMAGPKQDYQVTWKRQ